MAVNVQRKQYPEHRLQVATNDLFSAILDPSVIWFHIANQGDFDRRRGAILKGMGVKAGVWDWCLMWPGSKCCHIGWLEMKSPVGDLSTSQLEFRRSFLQLGHFWGVARSLDDVLRVLVDWRVPHRRVS